jgi:hypothetical protein
MVDMLPAPLFQAQHVHTVYPDKSPNMCRIITQMIYSVVVMNVIRNSSFLIQKVYVYDTGLTVFIFQKKRLVL